MFCSVSCQRLIKERIYYNESPIDEPVVKSTHFQANSFKRDIKINPTATALENEDVEPVFTIPIKRFLTVSDICNLADSCSINTYPSVQSLPNIYHSNLESYQDKHYSHQNSKKVDRIIYPSRNGFHPRSLSPTYDKLIKAKEYLKNILGANQNTSQSIPYRIKEYSYPTFSSRDDEVNYMKRGEKGAMNNKPVTVESSGEETMPVKINLHLPIVDEDLQSTQSGSFAATPKNNEAHHINMILPTITPIRRPYTGINKLKAVSDNDDSNEIVKTLLKYKNQAKTPDESSGDKTEQLGKDLEGSRKVPKSEDAKIHLQKEKPSIGKLYKPLPKPIPMIYTLSKMKIHSSHARTSFVDKHGGKANNYGNKKLQSPIQIGKPSQIKEKQSKIHTLLPLISAKDHKDKMKHDSPSEANDNEDKKTNDVLREGTQDGKMKTGRYLKGDTKDIEKKAEKYREEIINGEKKTDIYIKDSSKYGEMKTEKYLQEGTKNGAKKTQNYLKSDIKHGVKKTEKYKEGVNYGVKKTDSSLNGGTKHGVKKKENYVKEDTRAKDHVKKPDKYKDSYLRGKTKDDVMKTQIYFKKEAKDNEKKTEKYKEKTASGEKEKYTYLMEDTNDGEKVTDNYLNEGITNNEKKTGGYLKEDTKDGEKNTQRYLKEDIKYSKKKTDGCVKEDTKEDEKTTEIYLKEDTKDGQKKTESYLKEDTKDGQKKTESYLKEDTKDGQKKTESYLKKDINDIVKSTKIHLQADIKESEYCVGEISGSEKLKHLECDHQVGNLESILLNDQNQNDSSMVVVFSADLEKEQWTSKQPTNEEALEEDVLSEIEMQSNKMEVEAVANHSKEEINLNKTNVHMMVLPDIHDETLMQNEDTTHPLAINQSSQEGRKKKFNDIMSTIDTMKQKVQFQGNLVGNSKSQEELEKEKHANDEQMKKDEAREASELEMRKIEVKERIKKRKLLRSMANSFGETTAGGVEKEKPVSLTPEMDIVKRQKPLTLKSLDFDRSKNKAIVRAAQSVGLTSEEANDLYYTRDHKVMSQIFIDRLNNIAFGSDDDDDGDNDDDDGDNNDDGGDSDDSDEQTNTKVIN